MKPQIRKWVRKLVLPIAMAVAVPAFFIGWILYYFAEQAEANRQWKASLTHYAEEAMLKKQQSK